MKVKIQLLIILLSGIFLTVYLSNSHMYEYECLVEPYEEIEKELVCKRAVSSLPEICSYGEELAYDEASNTIYCSVNMSEPSYERSLSTKGYQPVIAEAEQLDSMETAIAEGTRFDFYLIGKHKYFECGIVFTGMPIMNIATTVEEDDDPNRIDNSVIYKGTMTVFDPYSSETKTQVSDCSFHIRGNIALYYPKKCYRLELENSHGLLGLRSGDSWALNALYDDAGLVHNKVSINLWNEIAQTNSVTDECVNGEYIELFINDEYRGVYLLTESPNKKNFSVTGEDILYKVAGNSVSPYFEIKYPKEENATEEDRIAIEEWKNFFMKEGIPDYQEASSILNMENAVDLQIFTLLVSGLDNITNNLYFVVDNQPDASYQIIKIPWDFNATFGTSSAFDLELFTIPYDDKLCLKGDEPWDWDMKKLYQSNPAAIGSLLNDRWKELRGAGVITEEAIDAMFDEEYAYVHNSGAYARNYEKWGSISDTWNDTYVYDFVEKRIPFLDEFFEEISEGGVELWTTDTN